ncbi:hypothetical protein GIB67_006987 [Kingdonia uniflora]|uniref:NAC domain-containing protein n=1 Tax=Kingdonia uniflora TaxID=39325 RepID=A0A7J7NZW3_9MAGN|nr:hypothetical protein GIB67_006987 [Kingdonia uniflora]
MKDCTDTVEEMETLPGFRFHPTEEELLEFYLKKMVFGKKLKFDIIAFVNIYHYDPSELPGLARMGEREWYFFVPRNKSNGNGGRTNRTTENGFWKATGSDRSIRSLSDPKRIIGLRKTLVFYKGRAPRGCKTDWIMNEYRMPDTCNLPKEDIVLCKIYRKATSLRVLEQRATTEEAAKIYHVTSSPTSTVDTVSFNEPSYFTTSVPQNEIILKTEEHEFENEEYSKEAGSSASSASMKTGLTKENLPELLLPKHSMDWSQDPLYSPWLGGSWSSYQNILNF